MFTLSLLAACVDLAAPATPATPAISEQPGCRYVLSYLDAAATGTTVETR